MKPSFLLRLNPELQRNIWLELTPSRMLTMPLILGGIFYLSSLIGGLAGKEVISHAAVILYFLLSVIWASRLANDSVIDEVRNRTWDLQRMSSVRPLSLTLGKLIGSTAYQWYGALICLVVFAYNSTTLAGAAITYKKILFMLLTALISQTMALLMGIAAVHHRHSGRKLGREGFFIGAGSGIFVASLSPITLAGTAFDSEIVKWYSYSFLHFDFVLYSVFIFLCWFLLGSYRIMRSELMFRSTPLVWTSFLIFLMFYFSGLINNQLIAQFGAIEPTRIVISFIIAALGTYLMVFSEPKSLVVFRKLFQKIRAGSFFEAFTLLPCWSVSLFFAMILALTFELKYGDIRPMNKNFQGLAVSALLFLCRDVLIFIWVHMTLKTRRWADMAAVIYLLVLYSLAPGILTASKSFHLLRFVFPVPGENFIGTIIPALIETSLMIFLVYSKWRTITVEAARSEKSIST